MASERDKGAVSLTKSGEILWAPWARLVKIWRGTGRRPFTGGGFVSSDWGRSGREKNLGDSGGMGTLLSLRKGVVWKGLVLEIVGVVDAAVRMARARNGARVGGGMVIDLF